MLRRHQRLEPQERLQRVQGKNANPVICLKIDYKVCFNVTLLNFRDQTNNNRSNLDIARLNRHIDHMQRICRDSLADGAVSRSRRRQMVRIKHIKTMLEALQRQIRSLRHNR